jgi:hypothetical protein
MKPLRNDLEQSIINWGGGQKDLNNSLKEIAYQIDREVLVKESLTLTDPHIIKLFTALLRKAAK